MDRNGNKIWNKKKNKKEKKEERIITHMASYAYILYLLEVTTTCTYVRAYKCIVLDKLFNNK